MSFMFNFVEIAKPVHKYSWLMDEQKSEFESTYFEDMEEALDYVFNVIIENGLDAELTEISDNGKGELPFNLEETEYDPMIEAMANWNEHINSDEK